MIGSTGCDGLCYRKQGFGWLGHAQGKGSGELDWHHRRMAREARLLGSTDMIAFELSDLEKLGEDNFGLGGHSDI